MLNGLVLMSVNNDEITAVYDDDVDADDLDLIISESKYYNANGVETEISAGATLFYFGNDEDHDGAMKTGNVTISLDGDAYNFKFSKTGGAEGKGRGITGIDDKKYVYKYGLKLKADREDKYLAVRVTDDAAKGTAQVSKLDSQELREISASAGSNRDGDTVSWVGEGGKGWPTDIKLLTTSGTIVKNKSAAKDGADWYFYVDNEQIVMYVNNKTLPSGIAGWKNWTKVSGTSRLPITNAGGITNLDSYNYVNKPLN